MFLFLVCILLKGTNLFFRSVTFKSPLRRKKEKRYVGQSQSGK